MVVPAVCCLLPLSVSGAHAQSRFADKADLQTGLKALKSKDPNKRLQGVFDLSVLKRKAEPAIPALIGALKDSDTHVRSAAADALKEIGMQPDVVIPALIAALTEKNKPTLLQIAQALSCYGQKKPASLLSRLRATLKDDRRRFGVLVTFMEMGKNAKAAQLDVLPLIQDPDTDVRTAAAGVLESIGVPAKTATPLLIKALRDPEAAVRISASDALGRYGAPASAALPALITALKDSDDTVRENAALAIGNMPAQAAGAVPALAEALQDQGRKVRANAAEALGLIGVPAAPQLSQLTAAIKDSFDPVSDAARISIHQIGEALAQKKKTADVAILHKAILDLEAALHTLATVTDRSDPLHLQETLQESINGISIAQDQLREEVKARSPQTEAALQAAIAPRHDMAEARRLIRQAEQMVPMISDKDFRRKALADVASAKAVSGDFEGAIQIAGKLGTSAAKSSTLRWIADEQAKQGDYSGAVETIGGIAGAAEKMQTYVDVLDTIVRKKATALMWQVFWPAAQVKAPNDDSFISYLISLGQVYAIAGKPEETSALAASLKDPAWAEIQAALYTIAKAYNHDLTGARAKLAAVHHPNLRRVVLETIMIVQLQAGDYAAAAATGQQCIAVSQNSNTSPQEERFNVALLQSDNGDRAGALATLRPVLEEAQKAGDERTIGAYAALLPELGDSEGALKLITPLKQPSDQVSARKAIAFFRAKTGDVPGALALAPADADAFCRLEILLGTAQGIAKSLQHTPNP